MKVKKDIAVITTGGTIDKEYSRFTGNIEIRESAYWRMSKTSISIDDVTNRVFEIMRKDSLNLTDKDREIILGRCQIVDEKRILITHGTDTMNETAKYLDGKTNKVIVLTGAMIPYGMPNSDAEFNIGFALAALQFLKNGVYIAMNGMVLPYNQVYKDKNNCKFREIGHSEEE